MLGIVIGLIFSCFIMYSMIMIEVRITDQTRSNWLETYTWRFFTSQIISPLIKALIDCILVVIITKSDPDSKLSSFFKAVMGKEIANWYAL